MRVTKRDIAVYIVVLMAALALQSTFAQSVPEIVDGKWVLPANDASAAPAGQYSGEYGSGVEQWRSAVDEACAVYGCSTDYVLSVIACESGGDPNAIGPNGEVGILQVDPAYWGYMSSVEQIWFFANPPAGAWWVCG